HLQEAKSNSFKTNEEKIELLWSIIKEWITNEAALIIGYKSFKAFTSQHFWNPELLADQSRIQRMTEEAQAMQDSGSSTQEDISHAYARLRNLNEKFREKLHQRRTKVFHEIATDLAQPQNSGSFMRMVKSVTRRKNQNHCRLDSRKINEHLNYYKSTFGSEPMGVCEAENERYNENNVDVNEIDSYELENNELDHVEDEIVDQDLNSLSSSLTEPRGDVHDNYANVPPLMPDRLTLSDFQKSNAVSHSSSEFTSICRSIASPGLSSSDMQTSVIRTTTPVSIRNYFKSFKRNHLEAGSNVTHDEHNFCHKKLKSLTFDTELCPLGLETPTAAANPLLVSSLKPGLLTTEKAIQGHSAPEYLH
ncbi:hypothetical protein ROZALSC1DRAFT_25688, partial [Rozella allomycis CSF55]